MTWVAVIMTPIVLAYQGWTYWVFRKRISTSMIPPQPSAGRADDRFAATK
jgi:Cytochrome bd-type quinol oxidase, subunit 2